jgi:hypothetical protein
VIDAETRGVEGQRPTPAREDDGLGLAVMGSGVEVGCGTSRIDFEAPAANSERRPVAKDENVRTDRGSSAPIRLEAANSSGGFSGAVDCHLRHSMQKEE